MRRKRRVELHIEHREVSIFAAGPPVSRQAIDFRQLNATSLSPVIHPPNPSRGSLELQMFAGSVTNFRPDLAVLNGTMQNGSVPLHRSLSGERQICTESLHQS